MKSSVEMKIFFCLLVLSWIVHHGALALENAPASPSQTTVAVVDTDLFLLGTFDSHTGDKVKGVLAANPQIERIVLTANGGSIDDRDTLSLGRHIRARQLDTHLIANGVATSGGVSLLLAGQQRSVGEGAFVGVHSWAQCSGRGDNMKCKAATEFERDDTAHDLHRDYNFEMLGNDDFYWFAIHSAAPRSIHWMTNEEMARFNVINATYDVKLPHPFGNAFDAEYDLTCHNCLER